MKKPSTSHWGDSTGFHRSPLGSTAPTSAAAPNPSESPARAIDACCRAKSTLIPAARARTAALALPARLPRARSRRRVRAPAAASAPASAAPHARVPAPRARTRRCCRGFAAALTDGRSVAGAPASLAAISAGFEMDCHKRICVGHCVTCTTNLYFLVYLSCHL